MRTTRYYRVRSTVRFALIVLAVLAVLLVTSFVAGYGNDPARGVTTTHSTKAKAKAKAQPGWVKMLPETLRKPCEYEDSVNCYWDAGSAGNGVGHSFVTRLFPGKAEMICVMYVKKADAKRWDYCEATA